MAQVFLVALDEDGFDEHDIEDFSEVVDEFMTTENAQDYLNMIKWLVDNDVNFFSESNDSGNMTFVLKDEDAVAFKLRWL